jgi:hypothetical protein
MQVSDRSPAAHVLASGNLTVVRRVESACKAPFAQYLVTGDYECMSAGPRSRPANPECVMIALSRTLQTVDGSSG